MDAITLGLTQQSEVIMIHLVQIASVIQLSVNQIRCVEASYSLEPQILAIIGIQSRDICVHESNKK